MGQLLSHQSSAFSILGQTDEVILHDLARYYYLTSQQVQRLHFADLRYAQRKLKKLVDLGYVQRLFLPRPAPTGSAPAVYTLSNKGRRLLDQVGIEVQHRYHPSEELNHGYLFLSHTLNVNDVLIAAALLEQQHEQFSLAEVRHERVLKRQPVNVTLSNGNRYGVIPDGWLDIHLTTRLGRQRFPIVLEVDRGTEEQKRWRQKVAGLLRWMKGAYQEAFGANSLTIAVVAVPGAKRQDQLIKWTEREIEASGEMSVGSMFLFTGQTAESLTPHAFFFSSHWRRPFSSELVPLIEYAQ